MVAERFDPVALISSIVIVLVAGCGGPATTDGRDVPQGNAPTGEETAAPGEDRPTAESTRGGVGLDVEAVSPGGAYLPAGFGEGSLWATDIFTCDDTSASCAFDSSRAQLLKRLDPQNGEVTAEIPLEDFFANTTEVAFGAGSAWVCSADYYPGPIEERQPGDVVFRIDPETNRVVDRIPVDAPSGLDFGHGSVWATSAAYGTVSRIEPETGGVVAEIEVGRGAVDVAADERSGAVWVAGLYLSENYDGSAAPGDRKHNKLSRIDPTTNRVVAEIPVRADAPDGGAQSVAVGGGAVWAASVDGKLSKVDPAANEIVASVPLGDYFSDLEVSEGAVWATVQTSSRTQLKRVDPRTAEILASEDLGSVSTGGYGKLVAGGGHVWFVGASDKTGKGTLARTTP